MLSNKAQKNITRERRPEPKVTTLLAKTTILEYARGFREFRGIHGIRGETVAATAAPTPPNTRAGGQDDGSYTNSLKQDDEDEVLLATNGKLQYNLKEFV